MDHLLKPIQTSSLKQEVIAHFENLILTGRIKPGDRLPPERDLAEKLEVSRPVVHEGLVELAAKGLIRITPRRGSYINDYLHQGNLGIVNSLLDHQSTDDLNPGILKNLLDFRMNVETAAAGAAAVNRTEEHIAFFRDILEEEKKLSGLDAAGIAEVDFRFHHLCAAATGNIIYPLLMNSLRELYMTILTRFYTSRKSLPKIRELHRGFVDAVAAGSIEDAQRGMAVILRFGAAELLRLVETEESSGPN